MVREATMEVKKDDASSNRNSSSTYSDDDEESQETEVSDAADFSSDSEISEFDKNNNRSPPPTQKSLQELDCNNLYLQSKRNLPMAMSRGNRHELVRESYEATSSDEYFSNDSEEYRYSTTRFLEDEVFIQPRHDDLTKRYSKDPSPSLRHINANENNNSNRKRFRNINSASYDLAENYHRTFRNKIRSIQLSSVRASKGKYKSNRMIPYKERMICKNGESNVRLKKFGKLDSATRYSKDIFTTLIDLKWTWVILLTALVYVGHWVIFGLIYWIFAFVNDDFTKIFGSGDLAENATTAALEDQQPCVSGVYDFVSAFLFSMESETTIGYGSRTIGTSCKGAIAVLVIQCVISAIFDTWVIGMCFSRMARPDARCETILYSKNAVICTRDGKKCLVVRVGNLRKSLLLGVSCRARIIILRAPHFVEEEEGHEFMLEQKELNFENANIPMLTAPVEYCHVIDKDSPLHSIPARYISSDTQNWFEVVIILTGIVEATGMTMHAQTSYLNTEIKYRHRFVPVISPSENKDRYIVDFDKFHQTEPEDPRVAKMTKRNKGFGLFDRRFDALVEESDEYNDDVFPSAENCESSENKCKLCGKFTSGDNNMNPSCYCDREIELNEEIKNSGETEA